jgi:predicted metal-binding membrane protein
MHEHGWAAGAASFVATWTVMMAAMMLPSLAPALRRGSRPLVLALGYLSPWAALGVAVHLAGAALAAAAVRRPDLAPAIPVASGVVVLLAGALQFTAWKAHHLARYRAAADDGRGGSPSAAAAWRHGLRLGLHCIRSCAGPTAVLLALGAMDVRVMAAVTLAVTAERLALRGLLAARVGGAAAVGAGLALIAAALR